MKKSGVKFNDLKYSVENSISDVSFDREMKYSSNLFLILP